MVVEVKILLTPKKVKRFLSVLELIKRYFPEYGDKRVRGAVAHPKSDAAAGRYVEKQGLLVIRATDDSASIVNAEDLKPREFSSADPAGSVRGMAVVPGLETLERTELNASAYFETAIDRLSQTSRLCCCCACF